MVKETETLISLKKTLVINSKVQLENEIRKTRIEI